MGLKPQKLQAGQEGEKRGKKKDQPQPLLFSQDLNFGLFCVTPIQVSERELKTYHFKDTLIPGTQQFIFPITSSASTQRTGYPCLTSVNVRKPLPASQGTSIALSGVHSANPFSQIPGTPQCSTGHPNINATPKHHLGNFLGCLREKHFWYLLQEIGCNVQTSSLYKV